MVPQRISCVVLSAAAFLASAGLACAASIAVGNSSFELPSSTAAPNYTLFPADAAGVFGAWEQFGPGFKAVYQTSTYGGTLTNAPGSAGATGPQAATIAGSTNGAGGGVIQDIADYSGSDLTKTFQAGMTYTLTVGVGRRADSQPPTGSQLTLRFYSRPADQGAANLLADLPLTVGTTPGLETTTAGVLTDYSLMYTVPAGSASIGQPIGIFFDVTTPAGITGGDFALDNVRLSSVPEPGTAALLMLGGLGLAAVARRRGKENSRRPQP